MNNYFPEQVYHLLVSVNYITMYFIVRKEL